MALSTLAKNGARSAARAIGRPTSGARSVSNSNARYLESVYGQWKSSPASLAPAWGEYFEAVENGKDASPPVVGTSLRKLAHEATLVRAVATGVGSRDVAGGGMGGGVQNLIRAYQKSGHRKANLDPMGLHEWRQWFDKGEVEELSLAYHGFSEAELDQPLETSFGNLKPGSSLRDLVALLESTYCGTVGVEYRHIGEVEKVEWVRSRIESPDFIPKDKNKLVDIYRKLTEVDTFETFLHNKYKTTKRFGVDGGEAAIVGIDAAIHRAVEMGVKEVVIGMPHRGRLNMLKNVVGKPLVTMFSEFRGTHYDFDELMATIDKADWNYSGDVKYHLGTSNMREFPGGRQAKCTLECNPSHLETVNTVTLGRTRAKQYFAGNTNETASEHFPILLHGDAAFSGQGVVYETMQLAHVKEFDVGGTMHVVINNQIGFTTDPIDDRSTLYCTDLGKAFNIPIFHCNGDDPVGVTRAFELAAEWRQTWGCDVIVDVICYRRFGHNETLNPDYTQPVLYQRIAKHPRGEKIFADQLVNSGVATAQELDAIKASIWETHEKEYDASKDYKGETIHWVATKWEDFKLPTEKGSYELTGVPVELLKKIGNRLCEAPDGFKLHNGLKRQLKKKKQDVNSGEQIDWGTAEALSYGTLLLEGTMVRITGQDVQSGTFAHRHSVARDQKTVEEYCFLNNLNLGPQENFVARNSILAEYAVLGFELGYTYENPNALVIWEAQFGDFANTAQVMIDQFISAGEHKWLQQSGLVMLLPHGYEGQGAEHSSARIERFLQLSDDDEDDVPDFEGNDDFGQQQAQKANWTVMNVTTPANVFHMFRRQIRRDFRKPMVVATTKSLFRHKDCKSSLAEMGPGTQFQRVIPETNEKIAGNPDKVSRLVFCSGKVYYELVAERENNGLDNVAIVRLEQVAPFPFDLVKEQIALYKNVDPGDGLHPGSIIWCQEEPKNMGPWNYVNPRIVTSAREGVNIDLVVRYVGRRAAASPATGYVKVHNAEQAEVVREAVVGHDDRDWSVHRPSRWLGHQT